MDGRGYLATGKPRSPGSASKVGAHCVSLPTPTIKGHPRGIRFACAHGEQQKSAPVSLNVILRFYFSKRPAVEGKLRPSLRYTLRLSARSAVLVANNSIHLVVKRPCRGSALRTRRKWATSHGPSPATPCLVTASSAERRFCGPRLLRSDYPHRAVSSRGVETPASFSFRFLYCRAPAQAAREIHRA